MRWMFALGLLAVLAAGPAGAQTSDSAGRIAQCVADNAGQPVPDQTKTLYCTCMASKMPPGETRSVTQWGQANAGDIAACARISGWR